MNIDKFMILSGLISFLIFLIIAVPLGFFYPGYDQFTDVISKQGAVDSPIMLQTNILFFLMGLFLLFFGFGLYRNYPKYLSGKIGSVFIILTGLSATLVGFFPCDAGCIDVTITGEIHQFVSELPTILAAIGLIFFIIEEFRGGGFKSKGRNHWAYIMIVFILAAVITGYIYLEMDNITRMDGLFQRLAIGIPLALTALVSLTLKNLKSNKGKGKV